ncbi:MAG: ABC transporter ATP-binding protein [Bacteroidetes bacterium]|nr:MAG: ABC transporter ATP-binding protein [Bacteroidota bacterium]MBL1144379.1 ABC transporter ATP-binding protein [Bacteroidota bacterium]NOG57175.1 ABC transporter ATP-binding protein [Bacteroidota bacterium]
MKSLKYLNKYLWKYKFRLILGTIFVVVSNVFGIYPAQIIREAFDAVAQSDELAALNNTEQIIQGNSSTSMSFINSFTTDMSLSQLLIFFSILVLAMALIKGIFTFFMRQTIIIMSRLIEFDLKNEIYNHYQELSMSFYKQNNTGDIMNRISEDVSRVRMYLGPGIMYTINLIALFVMVISVMLSIDVELTLYALAPLPILSVLIYYVSNKINKKSERVQEQLSFLSTFSQESFSGIRIIKSFVKEKYMNKTLKAEAETYMDKNLDLVKLEAYFSPIMMMLIGLSTILTIYIGGIKTINGEITTGNVAEFIIYVNMLTWPVTALGWVTSIIQRAAASQKRINHFLETIPEIQNDNNQESVVNGHIRFENVSFKYPESGTLALNNVSFEVKPGQTLAIIGKTGSGKSTIADLICRLFDTTEGDILIDNKAIKTLNLNSLRSQIGYVPQEVFLFSDSIKNNISFGSKSGKVEQTAIEQAAKDAAIYSNIESFPKKFDTELGERGITLSGGQKQRISIARAIINKPNILIFDDCLSAVDTETEEIILNNLKKILLNKTAIIISHRISSIKHADHILVLEDGEIIEQGKHNDLIELQGSYFETFQKQLLEEEQSTEA